VSVQEWTTNPYPRARKDRAGATPQIVQGGEVFASSRNPRTYNWSFFIRGATQNKVQAVASRRLLGPAVIRDITLTTNQIGAGGQPYPMLGLHYKTTPYADITDGVFPGVPPPGTAIWEFQLAGPQIYVGVAQQGFVNSGEYTQIAPITRPIRRIITDPEIYLLFELDWTAPGSCNLSATVNIFEDCDVNDLVALLG
jgi:hypothetical protein